MRRALRIAALLALAVVAPAAEIEKLLDVPVPMRDGVRLSANVFYSGTLARRPVILVRTPYGKGTDLAPTYRVFVDNGYTFVIQDVRGRYESEGDFRPLDQEGPDGEDTLNWIARQPWSDGNIGMVGGSYLGIVQWQAAVRGNPHLKAISPVVSGCDDYFDRYYSRGGAFKLGQRLLWMSDNVRAPGFVKPDLRSFIWQLPIRVADRFAAGHTVDWYQRVLEHPSYDNFWRSISTREKLTKMRVPVLAVGGWYDNFAQSDLEAFEILRSLGRTAHVVIGPWDHNMNTKIDDIDFGSQSTFPLRRNQIPWFDRWLKGKELPALPPAHLFFTGENEWRDEDEWPPRDARIVSWFLAGKGKANTIAGDGMLGPGLSRKSVADRFTYNPRNPAPTRGGAICCTAKIFPPGPLDQRAVETRPDILAYTSSPLRSDLEVAGTVRAQLYVSTSAPDTDFTAKLVDVYPDGLARLVTDGILRLRYRNGLEKPELLHPGERCRISIDVGVTAHVFKKGHRVRVEISSSNFPRFDRNMNTGRLAAGDREMRPAAQTVYHGGDTPSAVLLPVIRRNHR